MLSPTQLAIMAGLRMLLAGIPDSELPTSSTPTSAEETNTPPVTFVNRDTIELPKAYPATASNSPLKCSSDRL